jgi:hypothetical protein
MGTAETTYIIHSQIIAMPVQLLCDATAMDPPPSVRDGGCEAVDAMGFLLYLARKWRKIHNLAPTLPYAPATNPGCWSDSTPCPIG